MTSREAFDLVKGMLEDDLFQDTKPRDECLVILENLVSKDEADRKFAETLALLRRNPKAPPPVCTCGTVTPCAVRWH